AGVGRAAVPGAGPVAPAVRGMAQEGTALLAAQRRVGLPRVEALLGALRVDDHPPAGSLPIKVGLVPVVAPLPDVAGHVVQAVAVGREGLHRRGALVTVPGGVLPGELPLPAVALRFRLRESLVAPDVGPAVQAAAGGELPLRLGGQPLPRPLRI